MKPTVSTGCLILCLLALMAGADAQQTLNFTDLPLVKSPSPMPLGYGRLDWGNFFYVNPYAWPGGGPGFRLGTQGEDVIFIGGESCRLSNSCWGTLSNSRGFVLESAQVAAGFGPTLVTVSGYNNGRFVGSENYFLTTQMQTLSFPTAWGVVTEISILVNGAADDFVIYGLNLYTFSE
ncbi:MAG TPA: hypothetical protein VL240_00310 [Candidatus Binatia bacterium]|nr:hypothetical protein [Candidatus Binatia bacterium]